jgi:hypothetical protein
MHSQTLPEPLLPNTVEGLFEVNEVEVARFVVLQVHLSDLPDGEYLVGCSSSRSETRLLLSQCSFNTALHASL